MNITVNIACGAKYQGDAHRLQRSCHISVITFSHYLGENNLRSGDPMTIAEYCELILQ